MDEVARAIGAIAGFIAELVAAVIMWLLMGIYLCGYYTIHPHPQYREYLF